MSLVLLRAHAHMYIHADKTHTQPEGPSKGHKRVSHHPLFHRLHLSARRCVCVCGVVWLHDRKCEVIKKQRRGENEAVRRNLQGLFKEPADVYINHVKNG